MWMVSAKSPAWGICRNVHNSTNRAPDRTFLTRYIAHSMKCLIPPKTTRISAHGRRSPGSVLLVPVVVEAEDRIPAKIALPSRAPVLRRCGVQTLLRYSALPGCSIEHAAPGEFLNHNRPSDTGAHHSTVSPLPSRDVRYHTTHCRCGVVWVPAASFFFHLVGTYLPSFQLFHFTCSDQVVSEPPYPAGGQLGDRGGHVSLLRPHAAPGELNHAHHFTIITARHYMRRVPAPGDLLECSTHIVIFLWGCLGLGDWVDVGCLGEVSGLGDLSRGVSARKMGMAILPPPS